MQEKYCCYIPGVNQLRSKHHDNRLWSLYRYYMGYRLKDMQCSLQNFYIMAPHTKLCYLSEQFIYIHEPSGWLDNVPNNASQQLAQSIKTVRSFNPRDSATDKGRISVNTLKKNTKYAHIKIQGVTNTPQKHLCTQNMGRMVPLQRNKKNNRCLRKVCYLRYHHNAEL